MALAKLSNRFVSIRGRHAGQYFKNDFAGQHIQAAPRRIYRHYARTSAIAGFSTGTRGNLTWSVTAALNYYRALREGQAMLILGWMAFATIRYLIKGDKRIKLPPHSWFMHANTVRMARGLPPIADVDIWFNYGRGLDWKVGGIHPTPADGIFMEQGPFRDRPFYSHKTEPWSLWWDGDSNWVISHFPGVLGDEGWKRLFDFQRGEYKPYGTAEHTIVAWPRKVWRGID